MKKVGSDQAALRLIQFRMRLKCLFHFRGAQLENLEQVSVAPLEIVQHVAELLSGGFDVERQHPVDDMVGPAFVGGIEVAGFSRRFERPYHDPRRVRADSTKAARSRPYT